MNKNLKSISLRKLAIDVSKNAYSPYSKKKVGCALLTENNEIYTGCNVENASYGGTICAERVAIFKAVSELKHLKIKKIYVYSKAGFPPCGFCRQVISEFASLDCEVIIGDKEKDIKKIDFKKLLPHTFNSDYLI